MLASDDEEQGSQEDLTKQLVQKLNAESDDDLNDDATFEIELGPVDDGRCVLN